VAWLLERDYSFAASLKLFGRSAMRSMGGWVATSDNVVLEHCHRWVNVVGDLRRKIFSHSPQPISTDWVIDFVQPDSASNS
jgi:hypothetical protein